MKDIEVFNSNLQIYYNTSFKEIEEVIKSYNGIILNKSLNYDLPFVNHYSTEKAEINFRLVINDYSFNGKLTIILNTKKSFLPAVQIELIEDYYTYTKIFNSDINILNIKESICKILSSSIDMAKEAVSEKTTL